MMIIKNLMGFITTFFVLLITSFSAFAQIDQIERIEDNIVGFGSIVGIVTNIVVALAFLYFFFTLGRYILGNKDEELKKQLITSIIVLVVITSIWGIIIFIRELFGIEDDVTKINTIGVPTVQFDN